MTTDGKDLLLESLLGETLGAETPPDLTERILAALADRRRHAPRERGAAENDPSSPAPVGPASRPNQPAFIREVVAAVAASRETPAPRSPRPAAPVVADASSEAERRRLRDRGDLRWQRLATAACISAVALSGAVALLLYDRANASPGQGSSIAQATSGNDSSGAVSGESALADPGDEPRVVASPGSRPAERRRRETDPVLLPSPFDIDEPRVAAGPDAEAPSDDPSAPANAMFEEEAFASAQEENAGALATVPHLDDFRVLSLLDAEFERIWAEADVDPVPETPQLLWVRRVYLRVLGRIPTVAELREASDKLTTFERQRFLVSLTERDEFFDRWAQTLADEALGPTDFESSPVDRYQFVRYLSERLRAGTPFHEIVADLVSAEGSNDPQASDFDPAVNFLLATVRTAPSEEAPLPDEGVLAASRTARAFLGERTQCVQCHDHPENDWKQQRFWRLAAFFQQTRVDGLEDGRARIVDRSLARPEMTYFDPAGRAKTVLPEFHDFRIDPNGDVDVVRRREELGELVAASPEVYRALVHRVWKRFFGYGLAPVVDDLGPHREERFPAAVDLLAQETAAHGGRLQDLVRWIALSEPFKRGSALPRGKSADRPEEGTPPYFSRYYVRPLEPGIVFDSLLVAADAFEASRREPEKTFRKKREWLVGFHPVRETDEDPHVIESFDPSAPMILEMMHGDLTKDALSTGSGSYLDRLAKSGAPPAAKIEHLFLTAFARVPSPQERILAVQLFRANPDRPAEGLQNLWWALLNSNEFILDH